MTDTTTSTADRGSSLASMLLPELKQLAQQLGITGSSGMRKQELIAAISERQQQGGAPRRGSRSATRDAGSFERCHGAAALLPSRHLVRWFSPRHSYPVTLAQVNARRGGQSDGGNTL